MNKNAPTIEDDSRKNTEMRSASFKGGQRSREGQSQVSGPHVTQLCQIDRVRSRDADFASQLIKKDQTRLITESTRSG